jgi:hypothetical protein
MRNSANDPTTAAAAPSAKGKQRSVRKAMALEKAAREPFSPGEFVVSLDEHKRAAFAGHPGVVVCKSAKSSKAMAMFEVRLLHRTLHCPACLLQKVEVQESAFPLRELPSPVLALVLFSLALKNAAALAVVSRKFAAAFRDNVTWKRRCSENVTGMDIDTVFSSEKETSWMAFYHRHAPYRITIVTVLVCRAGRLHAGSFDLDCEPSMTVKDFLEKVRTHPQNRQPGAPWLQPHDPSHVGRNRGRAGFISANPTGRVNCVFRQFYPHVTIAEAGLNYGSMLEQHDRTHELDD